MLARLECRMLCRGADVDVGVDVEVMEAAEVTRVKKQVQRAAALASGPVTGM